MCDAVSLLMSRFAWKAAEPAKSDAAKVAKPRVFPKPVAVATSPRLGARNALAAQRLANGGSAELDESALINVRVHR